MCNFRGGVVFAIAIAARWVGLAPVQAQDCVTWQDRTPLRARGNLSMAYDSVRHVTVLFGGFGDSGKFDETWEWDGTNWNRRFPGASPSVRGSPSMAYDAARGVTVLFGGNGDNGRLSDTWEWNGTEWTQRAPRNSPSARSGAAMTYDSARRVQVLFGGSVSNSSPYVGDTWELSAVLPGDANCDGRFDNFDIDPFVLAIVAGQAAWEAQYSCDYVCAIDVNRDGAVTNFDIDPFVNCIVNGCP